MPFGPVVGSEQRRKKERTVAVEKVLVADVKGGVLVRRKHLLGLAHDVSRAAVLVAQRIADLFIFLLAFSPHNILLGWLAQLHKPNAPTAMLITMPSPLKPPTADLTTTSVSLLTKLRMQRSLLWLSWPPCARSSNLRAVAAVTRNSRLQSHCSVERDDAMVGCVCVSKGGKMEDDSSLVGPFLLYVYIVRQFNSVPLTTPIVVIVTQPS